MAQQTINLGGSANDGNGDPLRTGGSKINSNFTELYDRTQNLEDNQVTGVVQYSTLAELPATGTLNVSYKVTNDGTNNGYYHWNGSAYVKDDSLYLGEIESGNIEAVEGGKIFNYIKDENYVIREDLFSPVYDLENRVTVEYPGFLWSTGSPSVLQANASFTAVNIIDVEIGDVLAIDGINSGFLGVNSNRGRQLDINGDVITSFNSINDFYQIIGGIAVEIPNTIGVKSVALYFETAYVDSAIVIRKNDRVVNANDFKLKNDLYAEENNTKTLANTHNDLALLTDGYYWNASGKIQENASFSANNYIEISANESIILKSFSFTISSNFFRFLDVDGNLVQSLSGNDLDIVANGYKLTCPNDVSIVGLGLFWRTSDLTGSEEIYKADSYLEVNKIYDTSINNKDAEAIALKFYERGNVEKETQLLPCFLLAGQSNQDGRIDLAELPSFWTSNGNKIDDVINTNTDVLNWHTYDATNYVNPSGTQYFSYEMMLLKLLIDYQKANGSPTDKIYTVKHTLGGTSIDANGEGAGRWTPEFELIPSGTDHLTAEIETRYRDAKGSAEGLLFNVSGLIWHQGEGDRNIAENYYQNLKNMIWYFRGFTNNPKLPIVLGGINSFSTQYNYDIEQIKQQVAESDPLIFYAPVTNDISYLKSDELHFNYTGGNELANVIYNIMISNAEIFGLPTI